MIRKIIITIVAVTISSLSGLTLSKSPKQPEIPPAIVETTKVVQTAEQQTIFSTGSIVSNPGIIVRPEISGRITKVFFTPGKDVNAGDPLVEINPDIIKAQLDQYQADLVYKQLTYERNLKLYTTHTVSKSDLDSAQADLGQAKARVEQAKAQLRQTLIVAAFTGRVGISSVNVGDYVNAAQDIVSLEALDPIYVDFTIPEIHASQIAVNQDVQLTSGAYPNEVFKGSVYAIDPLINTKSRSINVRALIPNKDKKLLPGNFAEITLYVGAKQPVIKIPQPAVITEAAGNYVYKVINGHAQKTPVELGKRDSQNFYIEKGLSVGDEIVTVGQLKIFADGAPVIVLPPKGQKSDNIVPTNTPNKNKNDAAQQPHQK